MQKGFATLEAIFFVLIISILTAVAVPQAKKLLERATLDYEQKRLYSELKFLQTFSRSSSVNTTGMYSVFFSGDFGYEPIMEFNKGNRYEVFHDNKPIREAHVLFNGVTFALDNAKVFNIRCDNDGKFKINAKNPFTGTNISQKTIYLKPRTAKSEMIVPTIVFDSVGRIRGGREQLP